MGGRGGGEFSRRGPQKAHFKYKWLKNSNERTHTHEKYCLSFVFLSEWSPIIYFLLFFRKSGCPVALGGHSSACYFLRGVVFQILLNL